LQLHWTVRGAHSLKEETAPHVATSSHARPQARPLPERSQNGVYKRGIPLWKRSFDVCGAIVAGTLVAPLLVIVAVYIKLISRGPFLFVQSRVGHGGEEFWIYKFRTMHVSKVSRDDMHRSYVARHLEKS
jgi:lipopolysaccharide/colanic/teichoic acid biosynthesis glycosyltransferase